MPDVTVSIVKRQQKDMTPALTIPGNEIMGATW